MAIDVVGAFESYLEPQERFEHGTHTVPRCQDAHRSYNHYTPPGLAVRDITLPAIGKLSSLAHRKGEKWRVPFPFAGIRCGSIIHSPTASGAL